MKIKVQILYIIVSRKSSISRIWKYNSNGNIERAFVTAMMEILVERAHSDTLCDHGDGNIIEWEHKEVLCDYGGGNMSPMGTLLLGGVN